MTYFNSQCHCKQVHHSLPFSTTIITSQHQTFWTTLQPMNNAIWVIQANRLATSSFPTCSPTLHYPNTPTKIKGKPSTAIGLVDGCYILLWQYPMTQTHITTPRQTLHPCKWKKQKKGIYIYLIQCLTLTPLTLTKMLWIMSTPVVTPSTTITTIHYMAKGHDQQPFHSPSQTRIPQLYIS